VLAAVPGDPQQIPEKLDKYERMEDNIKALVTQGYLRMGEGGQILPNR
jgi:hypothetical protein